MQEGWLMLVVITDQHGHSPEFNWYFLKEILHRVMHCSKESYALHCYYTLQQKKLCMVKIAIFFQRGGL
jgi:hypothetical protein